MSSHRSHPSAIGHSTNAMNAERSAPASRTAGVWGELAVHSLHLPSVMEDYCTPLSPALAVKLLVAGTMAVETHTGNGHWQRHSARHGDLILRTLWSEPYHMRWRSDAAEAPRTLHLYLHQSLIFRVAGEVFDQDAARVLFVAQAGFRDPLLVQLGRTLEQELHHPTPMSAIYAERVTQLLAVHLLRHYTVAGTPVHESGGGLTSRQVQRVHDFVQAHLAEADLLVAQLAQAVDLSPYHFARMFRQATGESPHQFVLSQRLERAQYLLRTTETSIADVALASGFATQSYLTTVFKRRFGLTPRAYRRLMQ